MPLFPCVTYSCIWRNQGHSVALLALRICQELVPTVIQLIKTINMILASFNVVLPWQHFLDHLFNIHWLSVTEGTKSFIKYLSLGIGKIYFDQLMVCTFSYLCISEQAYFLSSFLCQTSQPLQYSFIIYELSLLCYW